MPSQSGASLVRRFDRSGSVIPAGSLEGRERDGERRQLSRHTGRAGFGPAVFDNRIVEAERADAEPDGVWARGHTDACLRRASRYRASRWAPASAFCGVNACAIDRWVRLRPVARLAGCVLDVREYTLRMYWRTALEVSWQMMYSSTHITCILGLHHASRRHSSTR
jgi:hypothetical protein